MERQWPHHACYCCGHPAYHICTACPGNPALHVHATKDHPNSCFLNDGANHDHLLCTGRRFTNANDSLETYPGRSFRAAGLLVDASLPGMLSHQAPSSKVDYPLNKAIVLIGQHPLCGHWREKFHAYTYTYLNNNNNNNSLTNSLIYLLLKILMAERKGPFDRLRRSCCRWLCCSEGQSQT